MTVVLGTFPLSADAGSILLLPFFFTHKEVGTALVVSNALGVSLLFGAGNFRALGRGILFKVVPGSALATIGKMINCIKIVLGG